MNVKPSNYLGDLLPPWMFLENDLNFQYFKWSLQNIFDQTYFLSPTPLLSTKSSIKKSFQKVVGSPWIYPIIEESDR
jgi:hypothetical protein